MNDDAHYSINDLAEAAGVSRRTVRFYVQRGVIAPPHGLGRGAYYDAAHLAQLLTAKRRQEAGEPLDAIATAEPPEPTPMPPAETWSRRVLAPGVELHVRAGALSPAQERALLELFHLVPSPSKERSS